MVNQIQDCNYKFWEAKMRPKINETPTPPERKKCPPLRKVQRSGKGTALIRSDRAQNFRINMKKFSFAEQVAVNHTDPKTWSSPP
jgi:hypothetical protein